MFNNTFAAAAIAGSILYLVASSFLHGAGFALYEREREEHDDDPVLGGPPAPWLTSLVRVALTWLVLMVALTILQTAGFGADSPGLWFVILGLIAHRWYQIGYEAEHVPGPGGPGVPPTQRSGFWPS